MQAVLSHYRILEQIGAGGMGVVYRAHDERLDRDVAIKLLPPGALADESARKRFRKEALALSKLNHPSIATIFDFDRQDGTDFLVQELIEGLSLDTLLAAELPSEKKIIHFGLQLCEGLTAAHENGVIHRDLKPANIRITPEGRLKILDFGLSQVVQSKPTAQTISNTQAPHFTGTLPYMAPEQLLGDKVDVRTDLWAVGCVLFEAATGRVPFLGSGPALIEAILHEPLSPVSKLNPNISSGFEAIVLKCMEKDPELRYHSAREIAIDLRRLISTTSTSSVVPRLPNSSLRWIFGVVALFLFFAVGLFSYLGWRRAIHARLYTKPSPSIAVLPFVNLSGGEPDYFSDGLTEEIINELARIPNFKVVARTSAFQFKGRNEDLRVIGQKLNVENLLEGSVQRQGERVRVTAQLIKASDGFQLWSVSYDRDLKDILKVEADIAGAVATALRVKFAEATSTASAHGPQPADSAAYLYFQQARYSTRIFDKKSAEKALDYINKAIVADDRYAAAYAFRAGITLRSGVAAWTEYTQAVESARRDVEKAMELDPNLPDAYRVLSFIQAYVKSDCKAAEETINKARELAPQDVDIVGQSALVARCLGRQEEASELLREALALDPLKPLLYVQLGQNLRDLGRYDEAHAALEKALDLNPDQVWAHETAGEVFLAQGDFKGALAEMEKEQDPYLRNLGMAVAYHALGKREDSDRALQRLLSECPKNCAYQIAQVYGFRGEADEAFRWLGLAYKQHDGGLTILKSDLLLTRLHTDPRFNKLLQRLKR